FLKSLGVKAIFDVSFGAELTVKSHVNYLSKKNPATVIAQPCPTLVFFIDAVKNEELRIKNAMDIHNSGGNQVLESLNEINNLIASIKEAASALLASGQAVIGDIHSLKAL
ncbi:MAG: hypothetical protein LBT93_04780, partial [Treponema sp.]|nr:hypothetical protein [Treponema sp.]